MGARCLYCGAYAVAASDAHSGMCSKCGLKWKRPASKAARSQAGRTAAIARWAGVDPSQRTKHAQKAAQARWRKDKTEVPNG